MGNAFEDAIKASNAQMMGQFEEDQFAETVKVPAPAGEEDPLNAEDKKKKATTREVITALISDSKAGIDVDAAFIPMNSDKQRLMAMMSRRAAICGFITPNNAKMDLALKKNKSAAASETESVAETYSVLVAERMTRKVEGVIIKYPQGLKEEIDRASVEPTSTAAVEHDIATNPEAPETKWAGQVAFTTEIFTLENAIKFIQMYCHHTIGEAPEVFVPFKKKATKKVNGQATTSFVEFKTPADMPIAPYYELGNKIESLLDKFREAEDDKARKRIAAKLKMNSVITPLMSSYRKGMLAAEGNYIAISKYNTYRPTAEKMSVDEAEDFNVKYIAPLFKSEKVIKTLAPEYRDLINQDSKEMVAGGVAAMEKVCDARILAKSAHYCGYKAPITADEVALVKKTVQTSEDGKTKLVLDTVAFGSAGNTLDVNGAHKGIFEATSGTLTSDQVEKFIASIAKVSGGAKAKTYSKAAEPALNMIQVSGLLESFLNKQIVGAAV